MEKYQEIYWAKQRNGKKNKGSGKAARWKDSALGYS